MPIVLSRPARKNAGKRRKFAGNPPEICRKTQEICRKSAGNPASRKMQEYLQEILHIPPDIGE
jgi:hypothetical protein